MVTVMVKVMVIVRVTRIVTVMFTVTIQISLGTYRLKCITSETISNVYSHDSTLKGVPISRPSCHFTLTADA